MKPEAFAIVAIGASAGGLDACRKFLSALPKGNGMAFILVQHLDPTHESMMVELLKSHTSMPVQQATDGMLIEPEHLYVIPPAVYLYVENGALRLCQPQAPHGARLPFDFLLHSIAQQCGPRGICVILSGTGRDGSLGLQSLKTKCGLIIAQDPMEAEYDGMPRNAIATGVVDLVLPAGKIPDALFKFGKERDIGRPPNVSLQASELGDIFLKIIDLLQQKTAHDFSLYKKGTLQRRIERRMAMAGVETGGEARYLKILRRDANELDLLAKDLLINVTGFFRDSQVFDRLAESIIPDLVRSQPVAHFLRIWVAGCSTGEEAYSLAMLFQEEITAVKSNVKLQVFASDVDRDAVAFARDGLYPATIAAEIPLTRLARFFVKEDQSYRVAPELRAAVIFTIQDVLADPPFSRIDMISCRNLMIYLRPEAQAKVISLFHFALRKSGVLLLGSAETVSDIDSRFEVISKPERLYRQIGRSRPGDFDFSLNAGHKVRLPAPASQGQAQARQEPIAELCRKLVLETYAPAAVLINRRNECLYSMGPTDRYLRVAPGFPTQDLLAMARNDLRTKLRSAIQQACQDNGRIAVPGGQIQQAGKNGSFNIIVEPVTSEGEALLLICFVDEPPEQKRSGPIAPGEVPRVAELEHELEALRTELKGAIRNLEIASEEQKVINEEALSVNEEYQSTNEELLTSKEELQSLNEELTALNSQLHETLERQRTTSDDLQNVLYSTDMATLFLDASLNIRFFTPATKSLFRVIPSDVGRPLSDLTSFAADTALESDARAVLTTLSPVEREVEAQSGVWFIRRILPYRTHDKEVGGVVITFTDVTERKRAADALNAAKRQAELANGAKSRFLAAASHDLRQPLQTLVLLQGLLAKTVEGEKAQKLVARLDETMSAMSGMLNTLLDINQIEAGTIHVEICSFPVDDLLRKVRDEFLYIAQAQRLDLKVVNCGLCIKSDPRLLEQMIRNLLSNALKYTTHGKVLLGCRRHEGMLSIEIWDTGIGIPEMELQTIFEEYRQLGNAARERSLGLGLGLSIVQRLGNLLGHPVRVRSKPGKGSVFAIEILLSASETSPPRRLPGSREGVIEAPSKTGTILVVEDDSGVRGLLGVLLEEEGHKPSVVPDGLAALELLARAKLHPDLVLSDYNLPHGMNGLEAVTRIREALHRKVPAVILTGDISTAALREIDAASCQQLSKPVKPGELNEVLQRLLGDPPPAQPHSAPVAGAGHPPKRVAASAAPMIYIVDDDSQIRDEMRAVLEAEGRIVEDYPTCEAFLEAGGPGGIGCLLIDAYMPGMSGLELLRQMHKSGQKLPAIMITGNSDVSIAVQAMKAGAADFIEKPVSYRELLASIDRALEQSKDETMLIAWRKNAAQHIAGLTPRQREIMELVLAGHPSKNIAADLGISQRTVENHRASIMKRTGSKSLPALARLALAAASFVSG